MEMFDSNSNSSYCETIKFKDYDNAETSSVYSVADSTVVISASQVTPSLSSKKVGLLSVNFV